MGSLVLATHNNRPQKRKILSPPPLRAPPIVAKQVLIRPKLPRHPLQATNEASPAVVIPPLAVTPVHALSCHTARQVYDFLREYFSQALLTTPSIATTVHQVVYEI